MARHRTAQEKVELRERAVALRSAGRSRREIQAELGIGEDLAKALLSGVPLPDSLRRPRAKDELRARAVELRLAGASHDTIATELGVSKASCSLWLRHLPRPDIDPQRAAESQERRLAAARARAARDCASRDADGELAKQQVASFLGDVTSRDLVLAAAVSYWCEGAKRKPWNRTEMVKWMNSDIVLVRLFLEGLELLGVTHDRLSLRLHIHETADEPSARTWWATQTGVPVARFSASTIKRHKPATPRHNVGPEYRGCLCVTVLRSRDLYVVFDGLVRGLAGQPRNCRDDDPGQGPIRSEGTQSAVG